MNQNSWIYFNDDGDLKINIPFGVTRDYAIFSSFAYDKYVRVYLLFGFIPFWLKVLVK